MNPPDIPKDAYLVRTFGYSAILLSVACLFLFSANVYARLRYGAPNWSWLGWIGVFTLIVGIGLVRLHKWAVACFALTLFTFGVAIPTLAVWHDRRLYTALLALAFAALLCWPAVSAIRALRRLA